ncbi:MAG: hypothetical protein IT373_18605 [Polyangiaceae bacterium]|nr:hypothetical protein [Polyangiaceae bacterium]
MRAREARWVVRGLWGAAQAGALSALVAGALGCSEAADGPVGGCLEPASAWAVPHPGWHATAGVLSPPAGDRIVETMRELHPAWIDDLARLRGWPARPTVVVPLDAAGASVEPSELTWLGAASVGGALTVLELASTAELAADAAGAPMVVVQPLDPFPAGLAEVVLAVGPGAIVGASPQPVCGADGGPEPGYAAAAARLPSGTSAALALALPLAQAAQDLGRLHAALVATPALAVGSVEARALDSFGAFAPTPAVAALLQPTAAHAILSVPSYQDADGRFVLDAGGTPVAAGDMAPGIVVALPATGTAPFPFVLYQHGGSQDKANVFELAGPLAAAGYAFVAIDLPFHGDLATAGAGSDLDILDFDAPLRTRDNLRQASANHQAVLTGIAALNAALAPTLGADALDATRAHYLGLSLGGVTGSMTFAASPELATAALFVGGGGYPEIVSKGMFSIFFGPIVNREPGERAALLALVEALLDGADPLAYPSLEERGVPPRPVLFFQAVGDMVMPSRANDQWARGFGADLATPFDHAVVGMSELALPAADNFQWDGAGASATRLLVQAPMAEIPAGDRHGALIVQGYSQELVAHCFDTLAASGSCEVLDTGYDAH